MTANEVFLYNTRTRRKETFVPIKPKEVKIYTCGPTVYSPQHIGNMRPYMFADLLRRTLSLKGLSVFHVTNITDVGHLTDDGDSGGDKMEVAAQKRGGKAEEIADEYTAQWLEDRRLLNCVDPDVLCKATDHIAEQVALCEKLESKGYTYRISDGIYFDISKFPGYANFAKLDLLREGEGRIKDVSGKRHYADFALWKFAEEGVARQQEWDSPWGRGFPGWHLECSAMSWRYLGEHFDIHTGGVDHIKIHHTNEIAQSEAAFDINPWVSYWMHNEFLDFRGKKMSKSLGNICVLRDLIDAGLHPLSYRYFFLQAHYRKQQTFTDEAMAAADKGYRRLRAVTEGLADYKPDSSEEGVEKIVQRFYAAAYDDLNAPKVLALAGEVVRKSGLSGSAKRYLVELIDSWLGLDLLSPLSQEVGKESDPRIDDLVQKREAARQKKNFSEADRIRDLLMDEGVTIEDTPDGSTWHRFK